MIFNNDQLKAINHEGSNALVLAGPGSGKTALLVEKFARTVEQGVDPEDIMAVTFTNKAAAEMRIRLKNRLNIKNPNKLWLGTFHSISYRILNNHLEMLNSPDGFSVLEPGEPEKILNKIMRDMDYYINAKHVQQINKKIDNLKNSGNDLSEIIYKVGSDITQEDEVVRRYQKVLKQMHCYDFGDLIVKTITLMEKYHVIRNAWRNKFKLIMIDEYQDSNTAQRIWAKQFVNEDKPNLFCVADDDQSIYRFRGADPRVIGNFENHWPGTRKITLRTNHRNPTQIIKYAKQLISLNANRNEKNIIPNEEKEGGIKVFACASDRSMYDHVTQCIENFTLIGNELADNMIMTRTNKNAEEISQALENRGIKTFLARSAQDIDPAAILTNYLRYITNNSDKAALYSIVGSKGLLTPYDANFETDIQSKEALQNIKDDIDKIVIMRDILSPSQIIDKIVQNESLIETADKAGGQIQIRFHHLYASLMLASHSNKRLYDIAVIAKSDIAEGYTMPDAVIVSTMHGVKGLQAKNVFALGWNKSEFPFNSQVNAEIDESRRLAYMTITRASKNAYIYYSQIKSPSRFISEMGYPKEAVKII